ncbi:MAG: hypothetical protein WC516_09565 [Patescibacteria group bacterium]|jgi:hypothetical protein
MKRKKLFDNALIEHPRFGKCSIHIMHKENNYDLWECLDENVKLVVPSFYSERELHFNLKWLSWTKPPYIIKGE